MNPAGVAEDAFTSLQFHMNDLLTLGASSILLYPVYISAKKKASGKINMKFFSFTLTALILTGFSPLLAFPIESSLRTYDLLPECSPCHKGSDCEQGKCWGSPLKCTDGSYESLKNCFGAECDACSSDLQCATLKCWNKKCVFEDNVDKCFKKKECEACSSGEECEQGKCWGGKCTDGSTASLGKCFAPECSSCSSDFDCATKLCENHKCIFDTAESRAKCFKKKECEACSKDEECEQGKCWGGKCTDGSETSLEKCFLPESLERESS
ncbi:unnamed protein product [Chondrus crispus]|uniref:Uncharacterized protein n=1 Tax=Chondrus crispus TaxID=2769 RepID=R7QJP1_CHOCR|nr:unnamed protein product [Chondrus crispus]CDF37625.1 unnamed protein product [Chondrus crispus]|eukprot:XP_005717496.1 unnamed protein product [Chondrus crispus]